MKTITKKNITLQKKKRKVENHEVRNENLPLERGKRIVLKKSDYTDLMEIKSIKAKKSADLSVLFFFFGLSLSLAVMIVIFNWKFYKNKELISLENLDAPLFEEVMEIPITQQPPPPPKIIYNEVIVAVPDEILIEEIEVIIDVEATEEMVVEEVKFVMEELEEEKAEEIFDMVEDAPEPIGGIKSFYTYVSEHMKYPSKALEMEIQGKVFIKFVVDKDGSLMNVVVLKGIGGGCDEEAVKVVQNAPKWKPGKQRGRPVKVYMVLPIVFKLHV